MVRGQHRLSFQIAFFCSIGCYDESDDHAWSSDRPAALVGAPGDNDPTLYDRGYQYDRYDLVVLAIADLEQTVQVIDVLHVVTVDTYDKNDRADRVGRPLTEA